MTFLASTVIMSAPCVLFASCSQTNPQELVKSVLGVSELPDGENVVEDIVAYNWQIENKYYSAAVRLCTTDMRTIGNTEFADSVQAFVVHFDSKELSSFEQVQSWVPYLKELDPDILMLVCDTCSNTDAVDRLTAQKFCIKHSFELVELAPEETGSDSEDDDFKETTGIKRVVQALHAHTWPNLVMKEKPDVRSAYFRQLMQEEWHSKTANDVMLSSPSDEDFQDFVGCETVQISECPESHNTNSGEESPSKSHVVSNGQSDTCSGASVVKGSNADSGASADSSPCAVPAVSELLREGMKKSDLKTDNTPSDTSSSEQRIDSLLGNDDMAMLAALGNDDPGEESFEQLFEKLRIMKERADGLPPEQRKAYAEKVAVSFWKAIGGDEDEIDGLVDRRIFTALQLALPHRDDLLKTPSKPPLPVTLY